MNGHILQEPDISAFSFAFCTPDIAEKSFDLSLLPIEIPFRALNKTT